MTREDMLKIMKESGALSDLDINDEDFLGGHGREEFYVAVMERAWQAGRDSVLTGGTPEQKRELASQLLTAANEQEGFPSDR